MFKVQFLKVEGEEERDYLYYLYFASQINEIDFGLYTTKHVN